MRVITETKEIFTFAELDESGKNEAIRKFYESDWPDLDSVKEDLKSVAAILGLEFDSDRNGCDSVYWSGFSSQGDGASFAGQWSYAKGMTRAIRQYAPQDETLHSIADRIAGISRRFFYNISARVNQGGHYCHEMTMSLDLDLPDSVSQINFSNTESDLLECFRDLARWFYRMLESEYDYKTSPEAFAELCDANAYEFDKNGNLA